MRTIEVTVTYIVAYGRLHGTGQWRNSGKGRFTHVTRDVE